MGVGRPATLLAALAALLENRIALEDALPAFTSNVADQLCLARKGRVEVGCDADLVVLDSAGQPAQVMARGQWMVRDGVQTGFGTFERGAPARPEAAR